jgi:hypothetical protein
MWFHSKCKLKILIIEVKNNNNISLLSCFIQGSLKRGTLMLMFFVFVVLPHKK